MLDARLQPGGAAPFHAVPSGGPAGAAAWLEAADGVRLRAVAWGEGAPRGTVLLFTGRTEHAEKYARLAGDLRARGFAALTVDWRGQGLSDRLHADRALGHVGRFADYGRDVAALVAHGRALGMPEPWFLLAHSMGGCIGLRALLRGLPVRAAAFSAPMWGIRMGPGLRPVAWSVSALGRQVGLGHLLTPGQRAEPYVLRCAFAENALTGDREAWEAARRAVAAEPALGLGGPSLHWLHEALREMRRLRGAPAPGVPALALIGTEEAVVDPGAIRRRMAAWPGGRLVVLPGARHEPLMEVPTIRERALEEVVAHFAAAGGPPAFSSSAR